MKCSVCGTRYIKLGGRLNRNRDEYQHSIPAAMLAEGESFWRRLDIGDSVNALIMSAVEGSLIMLECTAIYYKVPWPVHAGIITVAGFYTRLIWPHIKFDSSALLMKGREAQEQPEPKKQKAHKLEAIVKDERTGYVGYLDYEMSDWRAWVTFCKAVANAGRNFSGKEAEAHGIDLVDWKEIIKEFESRQWVEPDSIGAGRTPKLLKCGLAMVRRIADAPTL